MGIEIINKDITRIQKAFFKMAWNRAFPVDLHEYYI